jgi:hypothetical protein
MRTREYLMAALTCGTLAAFEAPRANAGEAGFSTYGLGGAAFDAGVPPPPGSYVTFASGYYQATIGAPITLGGVVLNIGSRVFFFQEGLNGLYVPDWTVLSGRLGLSITVPVGHIDMKADVTGPLGNTFEARTSGSGLGDINTRLQLGWQQGEFAHTGYIQVVAPSGRYEVGFQPDIGLNRPSIDTGWAFTWTDKRTTLQFNGSLGVTFNFENTATNYRSGTDFHFDWAVGPEICKGLRVGVVGYDYRQITGDSGPGAFLGPFKGSVDAVGPGLEYTTLINKTPVILNARYYQEYSAEHRWEGSSTILSGTVKF